MAEKMASKFRRTFEFPCLSQSWYPGHMAKGLRDIAKKIQKCDVVIEIQDARIPLTGRNPSLAGIAGRIPRILILNKMDLVKPDRLRKAINALKAKGEKLVVPLNCKMQHCNSVQRILPAIQDCLRNKGVSLETESTNKSSSNDAPSHSDAMLSCDDAIKVMIVGLPNVGKSSFINALRRHHFGRAKATPVGALPGMTRAVLTQITVCRDPLVYLVDTPGIMMPSMLGSETVMKLALTGTIKDHLIGEDAIADYALFALNKSSEFSYTDRFDLNEPCDDIGQVLLGIAKRLNAKTPGGRPDYLRAAQHFIKAFRAGRLGHVMLDQIPSV